jgi:hypothetical protein
MVKERWIEFGTSSLEEELEGKWKRTGNGFLKLGRNSELGVISISIPNIIILQTHTIYI